MEASFERRRRVEEALVRSRDARGRGDGAACVAALDAAFVLAHEGEDHELAAAVGWRRLKARHDFASARDVVAALQPLLELPDPFAGHDAALRGVETILRRSWDELGYREPVLTALCEAWSVAWAARGEPYLAAYGHLQKSWQHACRGELDALRALFDRYARLTPASFGDGPHRHARAADTPSSLWFVQMDLAHTALRAGTWARDERLARDAYDGYADAIDDAELDPDGEIWFLDASMRAATAFGWPEVLDRHQGPWQRSHGLEHPRAAWHRAAGQAVLALLDGRTDDASSAWVDAAGHARAGKHGPEWIADALVEAYAIAPEAGLRAEAEALIGTYDVRVFAARLDQN